MWCRWAGPSSKLFTRYHREIPPPSPPPATTAVACGCSAKPGLLTAAWQANPRFLQPLPSLVPGINIQASTTCTLNGRIPQQSRECGRLRMWSLLDPTFCRSGFLQMHEGVGSEDMEEEKSFSGRPPRAGGFGVGGNQMAFDWATESMLGAERQREKGPAVWGEPGGRSWGLRRTCDSLHAAARGRAGRGSGCLRPWPPGAECRLKLSWGLGPVATGKKM